MGYSGRITILIVEDEIITARDIESKLQKIGYDVCEIAASGEEAIKFAEEYSPDLILMDIQLEGQMDGIEATDKISRKYDIPIVYLTAQTDLITLHRAKITEPQGYIVKPFTQRDLLITIGMALYKHKMEMKLKVLMKMLRIFLEDMSIEKKLQKSLHLILSIPRLFLQTKGAIYLYDEVSNELVCKASIGDSACNTVPIGTCLCGKSAETRKIIFSSEINKDHTRQQDSLPHGHYCVPIVVQDKLLGLINVYVREGHQRDEADENILNAFADVIANGIKK
ncbi:MAG TPA: response regulator [Nitrospirae bacterium]|nr:response regulator [Nitrospirota bacterium]